MACPKPMCFKIVWILKFILGQHKHIHLGYTLSWPPSKKNSHHEDDYIFTRRPPGDLSHDLFGEALARWEAPQKVSQLMAAFEAIGLYLKKWCHREKLFGIICFGSRVEKHQTVANLTISKKTTFRRFSVDILTYSIHVWYIYLHLPEESTIHVGKYTSPMDGMGWYGWGKTYGCLSKRHWRFDSSDGASFLVTQISVARETRNSMVQSVGSYQW